MTVVNVICQGRQTQKKHNQASGLPCGFPKQKNEKNKADDVSGRFH